MKQFTNGWHSIIGCLGIVVFCVAGCKPKSNIVPPPPMVEVASATRADVPIYRERLGILDGLVNAQIRAQVTWYLLAQDYRDGEGIRKGDLFFEIDPRPALEQAKGALAQTETRFGKTELDVKRYAPLVKDKAVSQEEYYNAVQANIEANAAVVSAKAQVDQAQLNLEFTKITSPIGGIPSIGKAQIDDLVGPASGELTIVSTIDSVKAYFTVSEQAYVNFTRLFETESARSEQIKHLEAELILTDGRVYPLKGKIHAIDRSVGPTTGALRVEALFPNPNNALRPGQFARVRVKTESKQNSVLVLNRAVSELQGSYQVAVLDSENRVHIQPVRVGERSGKPLKGEYMIMTDTKPTYRDTINNHHEALLRAGRRCWSDYSLERELVFPFGHGPGVCLEFSNRLINNKGDQSCLHTSYSLEQERWIEKSLRLIGLELKTL